MKKAFTFSFIAVLAVILFSACYKRDTVINENYWLTKERGEVVYSDTYCGYYIVETGSGYTVLRSSSGYKPYQGSVLYGDFSYRGTTDMYNRSAGIIFTGTVTDYWLSYTEAQDALDYYCPLANGKTSATTGFRKRN